LGPNTYAIDKKPAASDIAHDCYSLEKEKPNQVLDRIMSEAAMNKQIQSLKEIANANKYVLRSSKQYFLPQLVGSANYAYYMSPAQALYYQQGGYVTSLVNSSYGESTPSLTLNQNIISLAQQAKISSNTFLLYGSQLQALNQAQGNALSASQALVTIIQNYNTILSIQKIISSYKQQAYNTLKSYQKGEASKIDVLSANSQVDTYEQELLQTKAQLVTQLSNLETLINFQICPLKSKTFLDFPILEKINEITNKKVAEAIRISPNLRNIEASAKSSQSLAQYYRNTYLPSLSVQFGMSGTYQKGNISGIGNVNNQYYYNTEPYVQLTINWSLFDGGTNLSLAKSQDLTAQSNVDNYQQQEIQLANNIKSFYTNDTLNAGALEKSKSQLSMNETLSRLVDIGYKAGVLTYLNFQVQASTLYNAYINYFGAESALLTNRLQYYSLFLFRGLSRTYSVLHSLDSND
jgi:outer membrane protein TolC